MDKQENTDLEDQLQLRAALYLRVSTQRQAEQQVSIPDQKRQGFAYCEARGHSIVQIYAEEGASALHDRRPKFQRMIEAALSPARPFDLIIVHSFSRFFRDHFKFELYARKLDRNGVQVVSMTQEIGDDPVHAMTRKFITLFDEYQSKETAKHIARALKENARQGFWCGARPPVGYRVVVAEQRGPKLKKKLAIDPEYAGMIRLAYRLALEGCAGSGPMAPKRIKSYLSNMGYVAPNGQRWQAAQIYQILSRRTYMGEHVFNSRSKTGSLTPKSEIVVIPVPPLVSREDFDAVQSLLRRRKCDVTSNRGRGALPYLEGAAYCTLCGRVMAVCSARGRVRRSYTCSNQVTPKDRCCLQPIVPTAELDGLVKKFVRCHLLDFKAVEKLIEYFGEARCKALLPREAALEKIAANDADLRLRRIYDAIEGGTLERDDPSVIQRIDALRELREDHFRVMGELMRLHDRWSGGAFRPPTIRRAAAKARAQINDEPATLKKFMQIIIERIDVAPEEVRLTCVKSRLLDAVFHIGEGTPIARVDRRRCSLRQPGDCFLYTIARI